MKKSKTPEILLAVFMLTYCTYFTAASFLRHDNFYTGKFDLGNMDQVVWNTANGRIFQGINDIGTISSRLVAHADFILIAFAPLYWIFPNPKVLLFTQTVVLAFGALFVYLIAKKTLNNKLASLVFSFVYLINPQIGYTNLYDFHAVTLATTFLLGTFYFLMQKRYRLFLLFAILAAFTKEQIWAIISILGFYMFWILKKKEGLILFLVSIGIFYFLMSYAIPQSRGSQHFAVEYFQEFGDSPVSIVKNALFDPGKTFRLISDKSRINYIEELFLPLGFTSFVAPFYLIFALPDLTINMLSSNAHFRQIYYQYSAAITPFLFIASIYGVNILRKRVSLHMLIGFILCASSLSAYLYGPLPFTKRPNIDMFTKPENNREFIEQSLKKIPADASVSATNNLGAHLSQREVLSSIPVGMQTADYIAFLLGDRFAQPSPLAQEQMVETLKKDASYRVIAEKNNFIIFQKIK